MCSIAARMCVRHIQAHQLRINMTTPCATRRVADVQKHWPMTVSVHEVMATGLRGFDIGER